MSRPSKIKEIDSLPNGGIVSSQTITRCYYDRDDLMEWSARNKNLSSRAKSGRSWKRNLKRKKIEGRNVNKTRPEVREYFGNQPKYHPGLNIQEGG
jgi:hypothetical protein